VSVSVVDGLDIDFGGDLNADVDSELLRAQDSLPLEDSSCIQSFVFAQWQHCFGRDLRSLVTCSDVSWSS